MNPGLEMVEALYISNFHIFDVKSCENHGENKKIDIVHCPFEKTAIEFAVFFVEKSLSKFGSFGENQNDNKYTVTP